VVHYELSEFTGGGPLEALESWGDAPAGLRRFLVPPSEVPDRAWLPGRFVPVNGVAESRIGRRMSTHPQLSGFMHVGDHEDTLVPGSRVSLSKERAVWLVESLSLDSKSVKVVEERGARRLSVPLERVVERLGRRIPVWSIDGPGAALIPMGRAPEGPGGNLILDDRMLRDKMVRPLLPTEVSSMVGFTTSDLCAWSRACPNASEHELARFAASSVRTKK
jgi:hypothetical protein